ncbi:hypothetical protein [Verticiella sediminum]|nr:hypothetical protein [Verticiella sediminum]
MIAKFDRLVSAPGVSRTCVPAEAPPTRCARAARSPEDEGRYP